MTGYSHPHLTTSGEVQIREEILKTENLIGGANKGIIIFRPPYGEHNSSVDQVAQELGYSLFRQCDLQEGALDMARSGFHKLPYPARKNVRRLLGKEH